MRLIYFALGWAAGLVLAANTAARPTLAWALLLVVTLVIAWNNRKQASAHAWLIALLGFTLAGLRYSFTPVSSDIARYNNLGGMTVEGVVLAEPDQRDDRLELRVEAETITRAGQTVPTQGLVLVYAPANAAVRYGDRVSATGTLVFPGEGDTFSYADFLARSSVYSLMRDTSVQVLSSGHGQPIYAALLDFKGRAAQHIVEALPEPAAGLLTGILLGNERGLAPDMADAFTRVGASHIIAISGFNMAILSGVIMGVLSRMRVRPRWAAVIGLGVLAIYTLLVGASAAVVRAAIMSGMLIVGALIRRKTFVPTSIAFVVVILSALNPTILWDVGFQLSLFATLGLALFANSLGRQFEMLLARLFPRRTAVSLAGFLNEPLVVSLAAQIMTLPLIVLYFGRLSPIALLVNLLIIPVQAGVLIIGLLATLLSFIMPPLAQALYWLDLVLLSWTIGVVRAFAQLPYAEIEFYADPRLIALFFIVLFGGVLMNITRPDWVSPFARFIRRRAVAVSTTFAGLSFAGLLIALAFSRPDGLLHIWLLDAGHSNAILVQTPGGAHILVDGGRFPSRLLTALGDRMPFNKREIDVLLITQPDRFDYGALPAVLDRYSIGATLTSGHPNLDPGYQALLARLADYPIVEVRAGYTLSTDDGTLLEVLHPQDKPSLEDSLDNQTLVARLTYGDVSFLLTSDLSISGQFTLLGEGQWPLADVLQLPRHGGVRSLAEPFLAAVQPQVVMVQAEAGNRFGDPDFDTLALLGDVPLFRTDDSGTLHFWTDGTSLWVNGTRRNR
ncbi:MAG: ComEC/Rec2 family competence protein [Anaerolineae bacterium]|nr:ComEC/Rec2 family competence protein [Anaerolineae bacterium]